MRADVFMAIDAMVGKDMVEKDGLGVRLRTECGELTAV
jgi:hypothetical protein